MAKMLVRDMPHTLARLECGDLSEWRAELIVREAADLSRADPRVLDAELCAEVSKLEGMGNGRISPEAKAIAHRLDDRAPTERAAKAAKGRRVTFRPAPDALSYVTVLLPAAQGAAERGLNRTAGSALAAGDNRSRGAVMADTAFERVMGRPAWVAEPVAVNLVLSDETLFGDDDSPAVLEGFGPIPAGVARNLVADALADQQSRATNTGRLYRHPKTGALVEGGGGEEEGVVPWSRGPGASPRVWASSSGCAISVVERRIVMPRFVILITLNPVTGAGRPTRAMVGVPASGELRQGITGLECHHR